MIISRNIDVRTLHFATQVQLVERGSTFTAELVKLLAETIEEHVTAVANVSRYKPRIIALSRQINASAIELFFAIAARS